MDLRVDFLFRGLALCFLHKAILRDEDCQFPPLDDAQFAVMSARIEAALGMPEEPFPKYLFQIVNANLGMGLIWPRDTPERDDAPYLLEVFKRVPPMAQGCRVVHVVEDNWLKVGLCGSEVIRYGKGPGLTIVFFHIADCIGWVQATSSLRVISNSKIFARRQL